MSQDERLREPATTLRQEADVERFRWFHRGGASNRGRNDPDPQWQARAVLHRAQHVADAAAASLDALPLPVWVLDAAATVVFANARAQQLEPKLWRSDRRGRLQRLGDLDAVEIRDAVERPHPGCVLTVTFEEGDHLARARLRMAPLADTPLFLNTWAGAHALLLLEIPALTADGRWQQRLNAHFGLTAMEGRILSLLSDGCTVEQIAVLQGVNASTVRTHLRALFLKTGRVRQSGLVRLALGY